MKDEQIYTREGWDRLVQRWERLVLLSVSRPEEGWEDIFDEIKRREIERGLREDSAGFRP